MPHEPKVSVSSTYSDLVEHRSAINEVPQRMKLCFSAVEFFGSRTDEAVPMCTKEIRNCETVASLQSIPVDLGPV